MRFKLGLFMIGGLAGLALAAPLNERWGAAQELPLYDAARTGAVASARQAQAEWRYRLGRIQAAEHGGLDGFSGKARLEWNAQPQPLVAEARDFSFPATFPQAVKGWAGQGGQYAWHKQVEPPAPLQLGLVPAATGQNFDPGDYDELWVDYTPTPGVPQCVPYIELQGQRQPYDKDKPAESVTWRTEGYGSLKTLLALDAAKAAWKEKDYFYLLGRLAGLTPDAEWRYAQDQQNTVVQRRMHLKLDAARQLEIAFALGHGVERVNLLVSRKDGQGGGELLEFAGLSPSATLPDGRSGVRLDLRGELARRFPDAWAENAKKPGTHHFYLQEIILFMPGEAGAIAAAKPVRGLALLGQKGETAGRRHWQALVSQVVGVNAHRQRLVVDLRKLADKGRVTLTRSAMRLMPPMGTSSCAVRIDGVRAVSVYSGQVPAFARQVEDWSRRWGGPYRRFTPEHGQAEQPGIVGFLPLSTLSLPDRGQATLQKYLLSPTTDNRLEFKPAAADGRVPAYRVAGPVGEAAATLTRRMSSNGGATLDLPATAAQAWQEGDALVVEGSWSEAESGQPLEIVWALPMTLPENAWFYFGVAEGVEQIGHAVLTAELAGGRRVSQRIVPNQALRLTAGAGQLSSLRLTFEPVANPYRIKLRELALFSPVLVSYGEARSLPLPMPYDARPRPALPEGSQGLMHARPGGATLLAGDSPVRLLTALEREMNWVRGLRLSFHLPPGFAGDACPLALQFNWANGQTERRLCPARLDDTIFVPLADLLGAEAQGRRLGPLRSIEWTVAVPGGQPRGRQEAVSLDFAVEGWAMLSALDQVHLSPLFHARGEAVHVDLAQLGASLPQEYSRRFWLPLEAGGLGKMAASQGEISPTTHPLFTLDRIVAEPRQPMDWGRWEKLLTPPGPYTPPRWPKWLFWISIATLAWATARKAWWSPRQAWLYAKGLGYLAYWLTAQGLRYLGNWLWRKRSWANVLVGFSALGPGLWYAGHQAETYQGLMWLALAALLAWGAYRHWRGHSGPGSGPGEPGHDFLLLLVASGNAVWALGHFGLTAQALSGGLPLAGVGYLYLPRLFRAGLAWESRFPGLGRWLGWAGSTVALYGLGLALKAQSGENYFFTFGGMAAVLALRAAFLVLEPGLRRIAPNLAAHVFGGAGSLYFSGALVMLVSTAAMLSLKLEPIAEQFAIVVYYCLVVGTVKEIIALRHEHQAGQEKRPS